MTAQQLKNSILQMAVQGKLVPQDPNDEPASVLLERIRTEKQKLIKEGKIKPEKNPSVIFRGEDNLPYEKIGDNEPVCIVDEVPFKIPESWEWRRLKDISIKEIKRGKSPTYTEKSDVLVFAQKCNVKSGGIDITLAKCLDMSSFNRYPRDEYMQDGDIVVNSTGNGTLGRIGLFHDSDRINTNIIVPDSHVTVIRTTEEIFKEYVLSILEYYQPALEKLGEGSTNQTELKPSVLADLLIPIPPVQEQKRITASLSKLKTFLCNYDYAEKKRSALNKEFSELLQKSILQQAVMGKLIPQDENDEPASVLLERIRSEKDALIKAGKLKKGKHESIIYRRDNSHYEKLDGIERCIDDEIPFEIPSSWEWCRIKDIITKEIKRGKSPQYANSGRNYVFAQKCNVKTGRIDMSLAKMLSDVTFDKYPPDEYMLDEDIIINSTGKGTLGRIGIFHDADRIGVGEVVPDSHVTVIRKCNHISTMFAFYVLKYYQPYLEKQGEGSTNQTELKPTTISDLLFPLPPYNEQKKIAEIISQSFASMPTLA